MLTLRPLRSTDIPRLTDINPTFTASTVIRRRRSGSPPFQGWELYEEALPTPYDNGAAYDFDPIEQDNIRKRFTSTTPSLIEVLEDTHTQRLCGILDIQREDWRRSAWIWNIMLDVSIRGQGWGKLLIQQAIDWANKQQLRAILLETQSNNPQACHFYAHQGFELVGINDMFYTNQDIEKDEFALFWGYKLT